MSAVGAVELNELFYNLCLLYSAPPTTESCPLMPGATSPVALLAAANCI